jgi:hypothetical protein
VTESRPLISPRQSARGPLVTTIVIAPRTSARAEFDPIEEARAYADRVAADHAWLVEERL